MLLLSFELFFFNPFNPQVCSFPLLAAAALHLPPDISGRARKGFLEKVKKPKLPPSNLKLLRIGFLDELMLLFMLNCGAGIPESMIMMNIHLVSISVTQSDSKKFGKNE